MYSEKLISAIISKIKALFARLKIKQIVVNNWGINYFNKKVNSINLARYLHIIINTNIVLTFDNIKNIEKGISDIGDFIRWLVFSSNEYDINLEFHS